MRASLPNKTKPNSYTESFTVNAAGKRVGESGTHGAVIDKIWCRVDFDHNIYIPLEDETIREFCEMFGAIKESSKDAESRHRDVLAIREIFGRLYFRKSYTVSRNTSIVPIRIQIVAGCESLGAICLSKRETALPPKSSFGTRIVVSFGEVT